MNKYINKKNISKIIFFVGISLLLYPMIGSLINRYLQSKAIDKYVETVNIFSNEENDKKYEEAVLYNEKVYERQKENRRYNLDEEYENVLNFDSTTIMGYIEIPVANIKLPIYHGVEDKALQNGVGHVKESSLPIGTDNQNSMLMGHTGLPISEIFTNLKKVKKDDYLIITILDNKLYYKVNNIEVIEPEELINKLHIIEGKDLVTLVTCTPYGVNSHRLIIQAERTLEIPKEEMIKPRINIFAFVILFLLIIGIAIVCFISRNKIKKSSIYSFIINKIIKDKKTKSKKKMSNKKKKSAKKKKTTKKKKSTNKKASTTKKNKSSNKTTTKKKGTNSNKSKTNTVKKKEQTSKNNSSKKINKKGNKNEKKKLNI